MICNTHELCHSRILTAKEERKQYVFFFYFGKIYERKKRRRNSSLFFLLLLLVSLSSPPFCFSTRIIVLRVCVRSTIFFSPFQSPCVPHHSFHPMERKKCVPHAYISSTHLSIISMKILLRWLNWQLVFFCVEQEMIRNARERSFENIVIIDLNYWTCHVPVKVKFHCDVKI